MNAPVSLPDATGATPVMAQYFEAKARQPDALVFFRMGDFYELFFDDAIKAAAALGISQTFRGNHNGQPIPMAGVPVHAAEAYLAKLIRTGFKVAVCEQMEDPSEARKRGSKAIVRRDVVRVITPGTLTEDSLLDSRGANRLAAVALRAGQAAVASVELSTGQVESLLLAPSGLAAALAALSPSETLVPDRLFADENLSAALKLSGGLVQPMAQALAEPSASEARVKRLYGVETLDGFGGLSGAEVSALGLIAAHLEVTQAGPHAGPLPAAPGGRGRRHGHRPGHPRQPGDRKHHRRPARRVAAGRHRPHRHRPGRAPAGRAAGPAAARPGRGSRRGWTRSQWFLGTAPPAPEDCARACAGPATWPAPCRAWRWGGAGRATLAACATG